MKGMSSDSCGRCHRALKNPESRKAGYGPVCLAAVRAEAAAQERETNQIPGRVVTDVQNGYAGVRTRDGVIVVAIRDGRQSPLRHVVRHSPTGLEWGYGGSGPAGLALSILADYLGNREMAEEMHQDFKWAFVARWDRDGWELGLDEIDRWLEGRQMSFAMEGR